MNEVRDSLHFTEPPMNPDGAICPRCNAQIVLWKGEFSCSVCGFDTEQWKQAIREQRTYTAECRGY